MKKHHKIRNITELDKAILQQKLTIRDREKQLHDNVDHFARRFPSWFTHSDRGGEHFFDHLASGIADRAAEKTGALVEKILEKLFRK